MQQWASESESDFVSGRSKRATAARSRGAGRIASEQLQLGSARDKCGEFNGELLDGPGGRSLLQPSQQRSRQSRPVSRGVFERGIGQPRCAVLEEARTRSLCTRHPVRRG